jgi:predicted nucleic acid-binding Zn ribbon protein
MGGVLSKFLSYFGKDEDSVPLTTIKQPLLDEQLTDCERCYNTFTRHELHHHLVRFYRGTGYVERDGYYCSICVSIKCDCRSNKLPTKHLYCHDQATLGCDDCTTTCDECRATVCNNCIIDGDDFILCMACWLLVE